MSGSCQAVIMPHQQMAFNLLQRVKNNTDHNQQGCASKELGELLVDAEQPCKSRHDGNKRQENGTGQRNLGENVIDEFNRLLTRFHTRNKAAVLLHIIRNLLGIEGKGGIKIGEKDK